jgi:hypothetical protein
MTVRSISRGAALGLLALSLVACGGGAARDADDELDAGAPAPTTAAEAPNADPNDPDSVGAIIYEEDVPVPGTTLSACQIVTGSDLQTALGLDVPVAEGALEADPTVLSPGHSECRYEGDFGRVIVDLTPEDGANLYDAAYSAYDGLAFVDGVGDGAFWSDKTDRAFVWQDRVTVMLTLKLNDAELTGPDLTEVLGQAMVAKL